MKKISVFAAILLLTSSFGALADDDDRGGPGESCRARSDCKHGLKCLANVCVDEHDGQSCASTSDCGTLKCIDNRCLNPLAHAAQPEQPLAQPPPQEPPAPAQPPPPQPPLAPLPPPQQQPPPAPPLSGAPQPAEAPNTPLTPAQKADRVQEWLNFQRDGALHPFLGVTLLAGFLNGGYTASEGALWGSGADGAVLIALRGGVLFGRHEIALEIAPLTDFWDLAVAPGPAFEFNASYGYLIPIRKVPIAGLSWPLRVGIGILDGGDNTKSDVFFQLRADVIGVSINVGHLVIDLHAPSFRYAVTNGHVPGIAVEGVTTNLLSFFFGTSVAYVF